MSMILLAFDPASRDAVLAADRHVYDALPDGGVRSRGLVEDKVHRVNERLLVTAVGDMATIARELYSLSGSWTPQGLRDTLMERLDAYPPGQERLTALILGFDGDGLVGYLLTDAPRLERPELPEELHDKTGEDPSLPYWVQEFRSGRGPQFFAFPHVVQLGVAVGELWIRGAAAFARTAIEVTASVDEAISRESTVWMLSADGSAQRCEA